MRRIILALLLVVFSAPLLEAQDIRLKGIRAVKIVMMMDDDAMDSTALRTAIELRCRESGIRILRPTDTLGIADAFLSVGVTWMWSSDSTQRTWVLTERVEGIAWTSKKPSALVMGWLWGSPQPSMGILGSRRSFPEKIRAEAIARTEEFLNEYWAANPKH